MREACEAAAERFGATLEFRTEEMYRTYRIDEDDPEPEQGTQPGPPQIDPNTGMPMESAQSQASLRCAVPEDAKVVPGLAVKVGVDLGKASKTLVVPTTAVEGSGDDGAVYGGSVYVTGRTQAGPLTVGIGTTSTDAWSLWLSVGRPIGEGKILRQLEGIAKAVNAIEDEFTKMSDDELRGMTDEFRGRLEAGETLDDILPEAFATVREAAKRVLGQRPDRCQP